VTVAPRPDAPVVIIGAGPVGLATALGFAAAGIDVMVLESGPPEVSATWRGSTLHPPTLEILDRLDLVGNALREGVRVDIMQFRDLVLDDVVAMPFAVLARHTPFPFRLQYDQYRLLQRMREAARSSPRVEVRYRHRAIGIDPGDDRSPAATVVEAADGVRRRLYGRWVVAADGSHSTVRSALGVRMPGETYATSSLVVATEFAFDRWVRDLTPVSYWSGPRGRLSLIRTPDTWRVALTIDDEPPRNLSGQDAVRELNPQFLEAMALLVGERDWTDIRQHQLYRSHQRVADTFNVGRVLLVGDAAHLSATTGGMGLNSGLHDAHELVQTLSPLVRSGHEDARAAWAVAAARRDVALRLVQPATRAARAAVDVTEESARRKRLAELRLIADDPVLIVEHLARACMLDTVDLGHGGGSWDAVGSEPEPR
jgi:3-(3-hydroxy-phenyl)propionate hydroxylase